MDQELATALQKNERLSKEVLLLRDAIDRSNEALEVAVRTKEDLERYKKLGMVLLQVWSCTCNHSRTDRTFNCNCCRIRYELEDLGLIAQSKEAERGH